MCVLCVVCGECCMLCVLQVRCVFSVFMCWEFCYVLCCVCSDFGGVLFVHCVLCAGVLGL